MPLSSKMIKFIFLLINFALVIPRISIPQKCRFAYLDEPCPTANCLPNAIMLTLGFDVTDGTYRADVLGLKWGTTSIVNPYNGIPYTLPDGVTYIPLSESDDITGTFIMSNTSESEKWQSETYVDNKDYVVGMCSHTTDTYQSITSQYQQTSQVGYVIYYYAFYAIIVPYSEQVLDIECYHNIMKLPETYDQEMYFQFIATYGTHFITESKWGLKYKFMSSFKSCMLYTHSESYVYDQVETDGWFHSSEHTTSSGSSKTDEYYSSRRYTIETFDGGNISYHNSLLWDQWVASGANMVNPQPVAMRLKPIYTIINDTVRQANMMRAYREYLQAAKQKQELIVREKEMGPRSVNLAAFDTVWTQTTPYYTVNPVTVKLAAGESSGVFGMVGSCNHMSKYTYWYGAEPHYYYCISQFTCQRDQDGVIKAVRYFDSDLWLNSALKDTYYNHDNCVDTQVIKFNPHNNLMEKYYWNCVGSMCYGAVANYPYNSIDNRIQYDMSHLEQGQYGYNQKNYSAHANDGNYGPSNMLSLTSFATGSHPCGGYAFCYMDCDGGTVVYYDAEKVPHVVCNC